MNPLSRWLMLHRPRVRPAVHRFGGVLCAGAFMSFVPATNLGTALFVIAYLVLLVGGTGLRFDTAPALRRRGTVIACFLLLCIASLAWLVANGGQPEHWGRAIVPFVFLLTWFHLPTLNDEECVSLSRWLLAATLCWALRILAQALFMALTGSDVLSVRLTNRITDSVLPYPLMALPLLLFAPAVASTKWRVLGALGLLMLYVWIGYRGGLLIVAGMLALWMLLSRNKGAIMLGVVVGAPLLVAMAVLSGDGGVLGGLTNRFSSIEEEGEGIRALEWLYAIDQWLESPIVGKGLGWQVPGEITFFGLENEVDLDKPDTVGYVHSVVAYFLMSLGSVGLLMYFLCILPGLPRANLRSGDLASATALGLWMLVAFFLTQASFRQVQTTMVVIALLKIHLSWKHAHAPPPLTRAGLRAGLSK